MSLGEQALAAAGVAFTAHPYDYREKGAAAAAEALGVPLGATLKTLVVTLRGGADRRGEARDERRGELVFVLVPGDRELSLRALARALGARSAELADERSAERVTGYRVGGIGPFGSRTALPVYLELAAFDHERVFVNGGRRGLLLGLDPQALLDAAAAELVDVSGA